VTVIYDLDAHDAAGLISLQRHGDVVRIGIQSVPHEFDDRPQRIILMCESLDVIIAGLKLDAGHI
jgi:hypothetical protein